MNCRTILNVLQQLQYSVPGTSLMSIYRKKNNPLSVLQGCSIKCLMLQIQQAVCALVLDHC